MGFILEGVLCRSPNHDPRTKAITAIVLHSCEGSPRGAERSSSVPWLCSRSSKVSCHYYVCRSGLVLQLVPDNRVAWHAGASVLGSEVGVNGFSLGIEIEHAAGSGAYPEAQLQALRALLQEKRAAYHIPLERIVSHRAVATPKGRKGDPSDWPEEALRAWLVGLGG